jgi:hypothetical protein
MELMVDEVGRDRFSVSTFSFFYQFPFHQRSIFIVFHLPLMLRDLSLYLHMHQEYSKINRVKKSERGQKGEEER